jgi:hypothetical protein
LLFICTVNGHCDAGQQLSVAVSSTPAVPNPNLAEGICAEGYTLCTVRVFGRNLHSRMPLDPTPARLKRADV